MIGANVSSQYEQTIKRDIEQDIPEAFISGYSLQKSFYDFLNGARLLFRPFDDPDKLRSYNLTMFVMIEASEISGETFHQLKTRLRNLNATTPQKDSDGNIIYKTLDNGIEVPLVDKDWRRGIIESNPDSGWIRTDILLVSDEIHKHGRVMDNYNVIPDAKDEAISTHVASTDVNAFLPPTFIQELCKNKPAWWIGRFVFSSFSYAEGLVYPAYNNAIIKWFTPDPKWKRIVAADYGLSDNFVYLFGAVDDREGVVYIYKEIVMNNRNIEDLSNTFHQETRDIPVGGWLTAPILDPKSGAKRDYNKKTLYDHFLDYGISFQPGHISLDARIYRLNTYLESGKLKIMDNCTYLIEELKDYKFPPKSLTDTSKAQDKPIDKNNHAINPLEWIAMALPASPKNLIYGVYNEYGQDITKITPQDNYLPHALQDDQPYEEPTVFSFHYR